MSLYKLVGPIFTIAGYMVIVVVFGGRTVGLFVRVAVQPLQTVHEPVHRRLVLVGRGAEARWCVQR